MFSGLGRLRGVKVRLHVDPHAKGAVQKQRRISLPLKDKFDEILDKWEEMDIIEDVRDEPTEWCSNVVLTPKKDGENIRARLDMTDANKYEGCPMLSTRFQSYPLFLDRKTGSADVQRPTNEGDLSDTNRFRSKSPCSIRGRLGKS